MKGLVFTEFLTMVENTFSAEIVEEIIERSELSNKGAYTSIGTYDHHELLRLVTHLSNITGISISELEITYGKYLFKQLVNHYPNLITAAHSAFDLLQSVDQYIHVEVQKLYPDAELPRFTCQRVSPDCLIMDYCSERPFADLAEGLILGCAEHFGEKFKIQREPLKNEKNSNIIRFILKKMESV